MQSSPIAIIATEKAMPPATVIAIANAIQGIATRILRIVSPRIRRALHPRRHRRARGPFLGDRGVVEFLEVADRALELGAAVAPFLAISAAGLHQRAPNRRLRSANSASDCSKASRPKSGQSSSRKTSSE